MNSTASLLMLLGVLSQVLRISSYFKGLEGDADVFQNPNCEHSVLARNACECDTFNAECVSGSCLVCKCRKKARIYRSDVKKCLSDIEARDPWCRYQFLRTRDDVIPTINLSKKCPNTKCSKPINAPFDKTKHSCRFSWVNFLENGTWHEKPVRKFKETFHLQSSDYFSEDGYMYSLEWKGSKQSYIPKRLFQVSLECLDRDKMKESYCLMFRIRGKNNPIMPSGSEIRQKTTHPQTSQPAHRIPELGKPVRTDRPTRQRDNRRREDTGKANVIMVNDNFAVILAAIAGALGTALIIIPIALFCRRTSRRRGSMRTHSAVNSEQPSSSFEEEIASEAQTSEETLSSYTSLKPIREPPSIYQPLRKTDEYEAPDEEPIYITVSGDEEQEPPKAPPIYHVLEDLRPKGSDQTSNDE